MSKKILVVGQGLAGCVLAWTLAQDGADVTVTDPLQRTAASAVAAGLINPVTGKRYAKSWNFEVFYPFAMQFYQNLERAAGQQIWFDYPIIRLLNSVIEQNEWSLRAGRPDYAGFADVQTHAGDWETLVQPGFAYGYIHRAARVNFPALRAFIHQWFTVQNRFLDAHVTADNAADYIPHYDHLIFCEGYCGQNNALFAQLPWLSAKGDVLMIRIPDAPANMQSILKKQITIIPYGDGLFWAGANYYWEFDDTNPTPQGLEFNLSELRTMLHTEVEVVEHRAAVRPVLKDRRPVMGWSTEHSSVGIFNGMGSKGALLTPYWAAHFAQHILHGTALDSTVDIKRFGL
jgi:glycine oxidase